MTCDKATSLPLRDGEKKPKRIFELDFIRGIAVFLMILIHGCYTFGYGYEAMMGFEGEAPSWIEGMSTFFEFVFLSVTQPNGALSGGVNSSFALAGYNLHTNLYCLEIFFSGVFMLLSGISCAFSKSNMSRSVKLCYLAILVTIALDSISYTGIIEIHIWFGILNSMSIGLLIYSLFDLFFKEWWQDLLLALPLIALNGFVTLNAHSHGYMERINPQNAKDFGDCVYNLIGLMLGKFRYGDDYFSPLNVTIVILLGSAIGKTLYKERKSILPDSFPTKWGKPIAFMGRHSLLIYVTHQIVIYVIMIVMMLSLGAKIKGL